MEPRLILKPPVRIRPQSLLKRIELNVLGPRAEEELFRLAEVMSEGSVHDSSFFGSTLITIDLERLGITSEEACARLFAATERSVRVRLRAMRLAQADATRRLPDKRLGTASVETKMRMEGTRLLIDVDLELPFELRLERGATRAHQ